MKHSAENIKMYRKGVDAAQTALIPNFREGVQSHPWFHAGYQMGMRHGRAARDESYMDKYLEELPDLRGVSPDYRKRLLATVKEGFTKQNAEIIRQQLGGSHFSQMTGAKNFVFSEAGSYLQFKIGSGAKDGINLVRIVYRNDLYDMEFYTYSARTLKFTLKKRFDGVYAEDLQRLFTDATGFYTRMR